jgi:hypothetical protein
MLQKFDFDMILQNAEGVKTNYFSNPDVETNNAILDELESFAVAINTNNSTVTLDQATEALRSLSNY